MVARITYYFARLSRSRASRMCSQCVFKKVYVHQFNKIPYTKVIFKFCESNLYSVLNRQFNVFKNFKLLHHFYQLPLPARNSRNLPGALNCLHKSRDFTRNLTSGSPGNLLFSPEISSCCLSCRILQRCYQ